MNENRIGTYTVYHQLPTGELVFVRQVNYALPKEPQDSSRDLEVELEWRNAEDLARCAAEAEDFEQLVDNACEWED